MSTISELRNPDWAGARVADAAAVAPEPTRFKVVINPWSSICVSISSIDVSITSSSYSKSSHWSW